MLRQIADMTDGTYYAADDPPDSARSTTTSTRAWSSSPSRWRSPRCSSAPGCCCSLVGGIARSPGSGGCREPRIPVAAVPGPPRAAAGPRRRTDLAAAAASLRGALLEPVADPRRGAALVAHPPPPAIRAVRPRDREPRRRDGPAGRRRQRPGRPDDGHPRARRLAQHVRHRHPAEPAASPPSRPRRRSSSARVEHPDRHRRVRRLRRDRPVTDHRSGGPARRRREPRDRASDGRRQRDPRSLDAIAEIDPNVAPSQAEDDPPEEAPAPVPKGAYAPAIVVLLTDGASNAGPEPVDAAPQAAARGIRVYTIGFGTDDPGDQSPRCGPQFVGSEPGDSLDPGAFGGFGGRRRRRRRRRVPACDRRGDAEGSRGRDRRHLLPGRRAPTSSTRSSPTCRPTSSRSTR